MPSLRAAFHAVVRAAAVAGLLIGPAIAAAAPVEPPAALLFTNTRSVEALLAQGETLWVATRGGVEAYSLRTRQRNRLYTTADGLDRNFVRALSASAGQIQARTERSVCALIGERFHCAAAPPPAASPPLPAPRFQGARVTARLRVADTEFIGTAGAGLFTADGTSLSPPNQICTNHVMAMARFGNRIWFGSFDEGLCSFDGQRFRSAALPAGMINALLATPAGLYVATAAGLFHSTDGERFAPVAFVSERGANGLAFDGHSLYVTTPAALFRLRIRGGLPDRVFWRPVGTSALQSVAVVGVTLWLASEDRGVIRYREGRFEALDRAAGLPTSWMVDVAAAGGGIYAATLRSGLLRLDSAGAARSVGGLPDRWILRLAETADRAGVWVGTQDGAAHVDAHGRVQLLRGLPHPCVHNFLVMDRALWVATEGGTLRYAAAADGVSGLTPDT